MTAATKTQPAKATSTKPEPAKPRPKSLKEAAALGVVKLVRKRKNGTLRHLPYLAPGSDCA